MGCMHKRACMHKQACMHKHACTYFIKLTNLLLLKKWQNLTFCCSCPCRCFLRRHCNRNVLSHLSHLNRFSLECTLKCCSSFHVLSKVKSHWLQLITFGCTASICFFRIFNLSKLRLHSLHCTFGDRFLTTGSLVSFSACFPTSPWT